MKRISFVSRLCLVAVIGLFIRPGEAMAVVTDVVCPAGPSNVLQTAIAAAAPGDTIRIQGNCEQNPFISTDRLTLTGKNNATEGVDGFVIVEGARRVSLVNMTVKNGIGSGILVSQGGSITLSGVTSSGHTRNGVFIIENSLAKIFGGAITDNRREGVQLALGSSATIDGVSITDNDRRGVRLASSSNIDIVNSSTISGNGRDGILLQDNSFAAIDNSVISGNGRRALSVADNGFVSVEGSTITSDIPDSAPNNGGILVNRNGLLRLRGGNTITNTAAGGGTAITLLAGSFLRQGTGHDIVTSTNGRVLGVSNQSQADLRDFTFNGDITVNRHGLLRLRKDTNGVVNGNIELQRDSAIAFRLEGSGSVTVSGTVTCLDTESSADFEDQTAIDIVGGDGSEMDCSGYGPGNSAP